MPAASLVSTRDRLVKPRKQRELAAALGATVVEVPMDHLGAIEQPQAFSDATVELVQLVASAIEPSADPVGSSPVGATDSSRADSPSI